MSYGQSGKAQRLLVRGLLGCAAVAVLASGSYLRAGDGQNNNGAVGGVIIGRTGVLENASLDAQGFLAKQRANALQEATGEMQEAVGLRKISLRRLEAAIAEQHRKIAPLSDEIKYLAGLQRVQYVFVYPEQNDIVLAGPGEGWKLDQRGNVVGITSGRPVLLLDDLLVALRTTEAAADGGLTCSIDPTQEGMNRLKGFLSQQRGIGPNPAATINAIQDSLGMQTITLQGVPPTSHFARVMVASDYRMKRLAMGFEPAPVPGMPSFLQMMASTSRGMENMLPRWWLAPNYDSLLKDPDGLAWELRGQGVKAMTEDDFLTETGAIKHSGKSSPMAQKWADSMTAKYEELSLKEPIFGELRNIMDLAVIAALISKENLAAKAGFEMPLLLNQDQLSLEVYEIPRNVQSMASYVKKGRNWVISASGGIEISSWQVAEKVEEAQSILPVHQTASPANTSQWWWN